MDKRAGIGHVLIRYHQYCQGMRLDSHHHHEGYRCEKIVPAKGYARGSRSELMECLPRSSGGKWWSTSPSGYYALSETVRSTEREEWTWDVHLEPSRPSQRR
jgi:hypothetical protein